MHSGNRNREEKMEGVDLLKSNIKRYFVILKLIKKYISKFGGLLQIVSGPQTNYFIRNVFYAYFRLG